MLIKLLHIMSSYAQKYTCSWLYVIDSTRSVSYSVSRAAKRNLAGTISKTTNKLKPGIELASYSFQSFSAIKVRDLSDLQNLYHTAYNLEEVE